MGYHDWHPANANADQDGGSDTMTAISDQDIPPPHHNANSKW